MKKYIKIIAGAIIIVALAFIVAVYAENKGSSNSLSQQTQQAPDLVTAANQAGLTDFVKIIQQTGVAQQFDQDGPYTIFAPTNEAINGLPDNVKRMLQNNPNAFKQIIGNHIYKGTITSSDVGNPNLMTIGGQKLDISSPDGVPMVNGHKVIGAIQYDNGVIYVIDGVIMQQTAVR